MKFLSRLGLLSLLSVVLWTPSALRADPPPAPAETAPTSAPATDEALFQRVVVLGASVSDGFCCTEPLGGPTTAEYRLGNYLAAALERPRESIVTHANRYLFLNPMHTMNRQVEEVIAAKPTLVIALDSLFWFCYGEGLTPEQRLERLEEGLEMIGKIKAPMIIGDIPDASGAIGKMLSPGQVPDKATLAACNKRIAAWAAERKQISLFPLADLMDKARQNQELNLEKMSVPAGETEVLLQADTLHPSQRGLAMIAIAALEQASRLTAPLDDKERQFLRDPEVVHSAGLALAQAAKPDPQDG